MKKRIQLSGVDCANCANKIADRIAKIDGVNDCSISFMTQKMILDYDGNLDEILEQAKKEMKKVDKNCTIEM